MEVTKSRGASSGTEQIFGVLLGDSVTQVFNGTLGPIAGQALFDALERHTSLDLDDIIARPQLLDEALRRHLGSVTRVLERRILETLAKKTAAGVALSKTEHFDFVQEIENVKRQFLVRKKAGNQPQILE